MRFANKVNTYRSENSCSMPKNSSRTKGRHLCAAGTDWRESS